MPAILTVSLACLAAMREKGQVYVNAGSQILLYSRKCTSSKLSPREVEAKKYEYFVLTRVPQPDEYVTGQNLIDVVAKPDPTTFERAVAFSLNTEGGNRFYTLTYRNRPSGPGGFKRSLAIVLDDFVVSLIAADGSHRSFQLRGDTPRVEVHDPLQAHRDLLRTYADADIHNVTAFLATLK